MKEYRFNIFGSLIAISGTAGAWRAFFLGAEGKRRPADFIVPSDVAEHELCEYLADLYHEHATPRNFTAVRILIESAPISGRLTVLQQFFAQSEHDRIA